MHFSRLTPGEKKHTKKSRCTMFSGWAAAFLLLFSSLRHPHWDPTVDEMSSLMWKASCAHHGIWKKKKKIEKKREKWNSPHLFPIHHPTSERSKPTLVITAGQKGSLLIISPLYVLLAQILDVSLCWGAGVGWFGATHYAHFTICSNAQKMCSPEWVSLLKTCHPSGRKKAASLWGGRRRGGGGRRHSQPHTQPGPWRRLRE